MKYQIINLHAILPEGGKTLRIYRFHYLRTGGDGNSSPPSGRDIVFGLNYRLFKVKFLVNIICKAVLGRELTIN
jgi:hypothetical protein